jgi:hypothetical protein
MANENAAVVSCERVIEGHRHCWHGCLIFIPFGISSSDINLNSFQGIIPGFITAILKQVLQAQSVFTVALRQERSLAE